MNLDVWGVDLVEEQLMTFVGLPALPPIPDHPIVCLGQYSINAKKSGIVGEEIVEIFEQMKRMPDVTAVEEFVGPGDRVVGIEDGMPTWIADVTVKKANSHEALAYVQKIEQEMVQPIYKK